MQMRSMPVRYQIHNLTRPCGFASTSRYRVIMYMKKQLNRIFSLTVLFLFSGICANQLANAQVGEKIWVVSGYLPQNPTLKVYVTVRGKKIESVSPQPPTALASMVYFNTEDYIFPGITDMHNHVKYNVLPLW